MNKTEEMRALTERIIKKLDGWPAEAERWIKEMQRWLSENEDIPSPKHRPVVSGGEPEKTSRAVGWAT